MHINHFFLPFRIVRIYILFFRIRINVLIILESIIICFIWYFYNTKWNNMTYTQTKLLRSKKYWRIKRQKRIFEIDLGVIWIGGFIGNDRWIHSIQRIRIRWDEELRWLVDWIFVLFCFCFLFCFFFFFVYSMHINPFFLPYCKNLCTFFTFFALQCAHQSFFSFLL